LIGDIRPLFEFHTKLIAAGAILLLTGINYLGVRFGGAVQNVFTAAKIIAILALVALTALIPGSGDVANLTRDLDPGIAPATTILAIAAALQGAFWTYDGWNNVTYVAGEVRNPGRNMPRALIIGMGTIILVYALLNVAFAYVLPIQEMASSKLVASDMADRLFDNGGTWIALLVMVSTFGTTNGTILASARVYFAMAKRRVFPRYFAIVHRRFHTPGNSLILQAVWSCLFVFSGTFDTLIGMLLFVSWVFYAAGGIGLFVLRRKMPDAERPYRVPLYPVLPFLFVLFAIAYVVLTLYNDISTYIAAVGTDRPVFVESVLGSLLVLLGTPLYAFYRRKTRPSRT
jgi:APA family basic amino acid/polyamine antiporter